MTIGCQSLEGLSVSLFPSISRWIFNLYTSSGCDKIPQSFRIKGWQNFSAWAVFEFSTLNTKIDMLDLKACTKVLINLEFSLIHHFKFLFH